MPYTPAQKRLAGSCLHNPKHRGPCPSDKVSREMLAAPTKRK